MGHFSSRNSSDIRPYVLINQVFASAQGYLETGVGRIAQDTEKLPYAIKSAWA
jgi:hypothetical protein